MPQFSIDEIFRNPDTKHRLTLFKPEDVRWLETQIKEGIEIASKVDMPSHQSDFRELDRGRLVFYVKFEGGEAYLNTENLLRLLNLSRGE